MREKLADWPTSRPWVNETEIKVSDLLGKAEAWLDDKEQEQGAVDASEEPVFRSEDVPKQLTVVAREFERLLKKPKPAPPKVDKGNSTTNANATASSNTTEASGEGEGDAEPVKVEVKVDEAEEKGEAEAAAADASSLPPTTRPAKALTIFVQLCDELFIKSALLAGRLHLFF